MNNDAGPRTPLSGEDADWCSIEADEARRRLGTSLDGGLTAPEAALRLQRFGPNRLQAQAARSAWVVFATQFKSALILVLLLAATLAGAVGDLKDALVILAVVVLNALVGFYQEYRAERSLGALKRMLPRHAHVRRDGQKRRLDAEQLVPGDLVLVEAGDRIPADGRLVLCAHLEVDESALTGESQPVAKTADALPPPMPPLGDQVNMARMNTMVTRGRGELLVTATGMASEMGRLSRQLAVAVEPPSPLQVQLDHLGKRLGLMAVTLVAGLFAIQLLQGEGLAQAVLDSIALAVAAMPEGLPAVVTVTLALGMHRLAGRGAVTKRLASVETLGCTTVICSDKTGTLTVNQMTVRQVCMAGQIHHVTGEGYGSAGEIHLQEGAPPAVDLRPLLVPAVACNDSRVAAGKAIGDPTEAALLVLAAKGGVDVEQVLAGQPRLAEVPFDSAHKFMATLHPAGDGWALYVKGAPDVLLARCSRFLAASGEIPMTPALRDSAASAYADMAAKGLRGLLIARRTLTAAPPADELAGLVQGLTFVGLVGLMDPPRPEVRGAIADCRRAGIAVKMITGDHRDTGLAVARELGLAGEALTGEELDRMSDEQLAAAVQRASVFARVAPSHKVKIVRALQAQGHVVAMTGDGVNDAPALKAADIGVAMGIAGTEVSKEAASMVLTDDNFATIVSAVRDGRSLYDNILKFIRFQLSTTVGALMTLFIASLLGLPEPFNAIQILWVALIMDGPPAVSLALDGARAGVMHVPPRRRDEPVLPWHRLARIAACGATMAAGTLAVLHQALGSVDRATALTLAFTTFVLFQFFNIFNARSEIGTAFVRGFFGNPMLWTSLLGVLTLQAAAVHWPPAQEVFGTTDLTAAQWALATAVAASVLVLEESRKALVRLVRHARR